MPPVPPATPLSDPHVEALARWAQLADVTVDDRTDAAIAAMMELPPRADAAPALALAATAAYARVPGRGPRDLQSGHRIVRLLCLLGEPGARELVRLRERIRYQHARKAVDAALAGLARELRIPLGELEDAFGGPRLDPDLALSLPAGPFLARIHVSDDLRRVRTGWRTESGAPRRSRPARAAEYSEQLAHIQAERRRLQSHLSDLRGRLEDAMVSGRSWSADQWAARMFADPLRSALARRLVWRFETADSSVLALPTAKGVEDVAGRAVRVRPDANVELWHPAESPVAQRPWQQRAAEIGLDQPVDQIQREVTIADARRLHLADGVVVNQRSFRGFLMRRGWHVPYVGPWFTVLEATHDLMRGGPEAVLHLHHADDEGSVIVLDVAFRSVHGRDLDARKLPGPLVSEAARDVLGAVKVGTSAADGPNSSGHAARRLLGPDR
jgi:hypothetical protein